VNELSIEWKLSPELEKLKIPEGLGESWINSSRKVRLHIL